MLNKNYQALSHLQLGRYAEYLVKMELTSYGLDVYTSEVDDHGVDFVFKAGKEFYEVQVKSARLDRTSYVFMSKDKFDVDNENLYLALVLFDEGMEPQVYIIPSFSWKRENDLFRNRTYLNKKSKPEWGLNISNKNLYLLESYLLTDELLRRNFVDFMKNTISDKEQNINNEANYTCVGVDACKGKWVAVALGNWGYEVAKYDTIDDICNKYSDANQIVIDIPIGLRDNDKQVRPDCLVKKKLGAKGSSVFEVPCRQAIYSDTNEEARALNIEILGRSLSAQSISFSKSIRQVDEFLLENEKWRNVLIESHPEFCFMLLNDGKPVMEKKLTDQGIQKRLDILTKYDARSRQVVQAFLDEVPYRKKIDDVVDALSLAVMGKMILDNGLKTIPENPMEDNLGIRMQICYGEV